jgi:hypothetical protein
MKWIKLVYLGSVANFHEKCTEPSYGIDQGFQPGALLISLTCL